MQYRELGKTGLRVSEIGLGSWGIGGTWWGGPQDENSRPAIIRAMELGINFLDTALVYGDGHSERLIGSILKETKQPAYVATKVPPKDYHWPPDNPNILKTFPVKWVKECVDKSLKNLQLEQVDLLQYHVWHKDWASQDEWKEAKEKLKAEGKILFFGLSLNDHDPDCGVDAVATGEIDCVQVIYNIFDQSPEQNLFPACRKHETGVIARCPLDESGLTGKLTSKTTFAEGDFRGRYFKGKRLTETVDRAEKLKFLVRDDVRSIAQGALKFVLSPPAVSTTIPGMRRSEHVEENVRASGGSPLSEDVLEELKKHAWPRNFYGG
ncbi:MAG: aldo/keto reductase [Nitrospirae bacterium]|nr:aldo/keto reductase [Nitrospirota bacterium]